jgi:hypothetical protein
MRMPKNKQRKSRIAKNLSQGSVVEQTAGVLKTNLPAITPQEEREAAEQAIAKEAIERMRG